jgi:hypothetical protein
MTRISNSANPKRGNASRRRATRAPRAPQFDTPSTSLRSLVAHHDAAAARAAPVPSSPVQPRESHPRGYGNMTVTRDATGAPTITFEGNAPPPPEVTRAVRTIVQMIATMEAHAMFLYLAAEPAPAGVTREQLNEHTRVCRCPAAMRGEDCVVCFNQVGARHNVRTLRCGHGFHHKCIDKWLEDHDNCPLCRELVVPAEPDATIAAG